jgi:acyl-CoA dehydrogenase
MAGGGWRMLMECLAAGRSISLPSSNTGMAQMTARAVGGYARVRSQFKMAVGKFEGVEEALTRIGAYTYMMDAVRKMTAGAVDLGEKPSVVSAIAKYHVTERARQVVNDGMDVIGGKGICLGPSNFMGRAYQQVPIGITVEGRQYSDPFADHLRAGCHPLPSLPAGRNAGGAEPGCKKRAGRFRQGLVGPHRLHHQEWIPRPVAGHDRFALCYGQRRNGAGNEALLPADDALLGRLCLHGRYFLAGARRQRQAP